MKEKWAQLNAQEKQLVTIAGVLLSLILFYAMIWAPVSNTVVEKRVKLVKQRELQQWATSAIGKIRASQSQTGSGTSMQNIVNSSVRRYNIQVSRIQPKGEQLAVWVENTGFDQLMQWVAELENNRGLRVVTFDVVAEDESGMVRVRGLTLEKA